MKETGPLHKNIHFNIGVIFTVIEGFFFWMQLYDDLPSHSDPARQENNYNRHLNDHRNSVRSLCFASAYLQYRLYTEPDRRGCRFKKSSPFPWR